MFRYFKEIVNQQTGIGFGSFGTADKIYDGLVNKCIQERNDIARGYLVENKQTFISKLAQALEDGMNYSIYQDQTDGKKENFRTILIDKLYLELDKVQNQSDYAKTFGSSIALQGLVAVSRNDAQFLEKQSPAP